MKLIDAGNLILFKEDEERNSLWESYKNPTDTFLPGMFMDEKLILVSWASPDDPARGEFSFQKEDKQYIIKKEKREKSTYRWKSGVSGDFISDDIGIVLGTHDHDFACDLLIRIAKLLNDEVISGCDSWYDLAEIFMERAGLLDFSIYLEADKLDKLHANMDHIMSIL